MVSDDWKICLGYEKSQKKAFIPCCQKLSMPLLIAYLKPIWVHKEPPLPPPPAQRTEIEKKLSHAAFGRVVCQG